MDLGLIESQVQAALRRSLGPAAVVLCGPPVSGPTTCLRAEVFVHAVAFQDFGGVTAEGAHSARRPWSPVAGASGYAEERPGRIVVEVTCVTASLRQAQRLCGQLAAPLLVALETLPAPVLAGRHGDALELRFADSQAVLAAVQASRLVDGAVVCHHGRIVVHLDGFLHLRLAVSGGLVAAAPPALSLRVAHDPAGPDLARECAVLGNPTDAAVELTGWVLHDAARRVHRYVFPEVVLAPDAELRLWTGRGETTPHDLYWGRRQAVWNNRGDVAVLLDRQGVEVARFVCGEPVEALPRQRNTRARNVR